MQVYDVVMKHKDNALWGNFEAMIKANSNILSVSLQTMILGDNLGDNCYIVGDIWGTIAILSPPLENVGNMSTLSPPIYTYGQETIKRSQDI